jgi:hypothetical protein
MILTKNVKYLNYCSKQMNGKGLAFVERYFCDEFRHSGVNAKPLPWDIFSCKTLQFVLLFRFTDCF